jgi:hypothetical protein
MGAGRRGPRHLPPPQQTFEKKIRIEENKDIYQTLINKY